MISDQKKKKIIPVFFSDYTLLSGSRTSLKLKSVAYRYLLFLLVLTLAGEILL